MRWLFTFEEVTLTIICALSPGTISATSVRFDGATTEEVFELLPVLCYQKW